MDSTKDDSNVSPVTIIYIYIYGLLANSKVFSHIENVGGNGGAFVSSDKTNKIACSNN
jgi:hypothetical protein